MLIAPVVIHLSRSYVNVNALSAGIQFLLLRLNFQTDLLSMITILLCVAYLAAFVFISHSFTQFSANRNQSDLKKTWHTQNPAFMSETTMNMSLSAQS